MTTIEGDRMNLIKKVPDLTLGLPIQPNIWIPSPYLISPHPVLASENELLAECIRNLAFPSDYDTNPYWQTPIGHNFALTRQFVCGEFIRKFVNKNFPLWKIPRYCRREIKQSFSFQAELMGQIWRTIKLLPLSRNPRPLVFHVINLERALIFFNFFHQEEEGGEALTSTAIVKKQQGFNRELQSLENPFESDSSPETWSFVEECRRIANIDNDFRSDYMKLIHARMTLLKDIRKNSPKRIDQSGKFKENRGRKSISSSRSRST